MKGGAVEKDSDMPKIDRFASKADGPVHSGNTLTSPVFPVKARLACGMRSCIERLLLALVLTVFMGCVTHGPVKTASKAPKAEKPQVDDAQKDEQIHDGFTIKEIAQMNVAARRDFERAVALLNEEDYGPAIALLEKIVAQQPRVTAPYINLGIAYARTDKTEEAEAQFKKALELVPGHPVAGNECGLLFRKQGRFKEARNMYEQVLTGYPNYYPAHRNLGILCDLYLNELESAMAHYQIYSQAIPKDEQVKLWIADLKIRMGTK